MRDERILGGRSCFISCREVVDSASLTSDRFIDGVRVRPDPLNDDSVCSVEERDMPFMPGTTVDDPEEEPVVIRLLAVSKCVFDLGISSPLVSLIAVTSRFKLDLLARLTAVDVRGSPRPRPELSVSVSASIVDSRRWERLAGTR